MSIRTRAALARQAPGRFEPVDLDLDEPRVDEVLVRMVSAGLCHSDDHAATGDIPFAHYPLVGGHEGAGIVEQIGSAVTDVAVGDHVVFAFLPVCGRCRWCASGMQNLCDQGASMQTGARVRDPGSFRLSEHGHPVAQMGGLGTFSQYTTVQAQTVVKVDRDAPLDKISLLGCGVCTGWGSAVNSAQVRTGDTVIVMGAGGLGTSAIQAARFAGASAVIAADPVEFKRSSALHFGATHTARDIDEAADIARSLTDGQGADATIVTVGVVEGAHVGRAFSSVRKAGTVVVTSVGALNEVIEGVPLFELTMFQKRIQGSLFGQSNPTHDIKKMLRLYKNGDFNLDDMITKTYSIDDVAQGYDDLKAGMTVRGVVLFE